jgi:hypothetical protein
MRTKEQAMIEMLQGKKFIYCGEVCYYMRGDFLIDGTPIDEAWGYVDQWQEYNEPAPVFPFKPFDRVCARDQGRWHANFYSHIMQNGFMLMGSIWESVTDFDPDLLGTIDTPKTTVWNVVDGEPEPV